MQPACYFFHYPITGCLRRDNSLSSAGIISWSRSTSLAHVGLKEPAFCVATAQQAMQLRSPELLASARNHPAWPSAPLRVRGARVAGRPNSLLETRSWEKNICRLLDSNQRTSVRGRKTPRSTPLHQDHVAVYNKNPSYLILLLVQH